MCISLLLPYVLLCSCIKASNKFLSVKIVGIEGIEGIGGYRGYLKLSVALEFRRVRSTSSAML